MTEHRCFIRRKRLFYLAQTFVLSSANVCFYPEARKDVAAVMKNHSRRRISLWMHVIICIMPCVVILSGCAGEQNTTVPDSSSGAAQTGDIPSRAADISPQSTLLSVNGRAVPAWKYLYWLSMDCDRIRDRFQSDGQSPDWNRLVDNGQNISRFADENNMPQSVTLAQFVKEQALSDTALYEIVEETAQSYGVALTEEDRAAVENQWRERCETSGSEAAFLSLIAPYGLNRERTEALFSVRRLCTKLYAACQAGMFGPSEDELETLAAESDTVQVERLLAAADGDRTAARRKAENWFSQLNGSPEQDSLFIRLSAESDDRNGSRTVTDETFEPKLVQISNALNIGQISGIIETEEGFSILRRVRPEREILLPLWFEKMLVQSAANAEIAVSDECLKLDTAVFAMALERLRG